MRFFKVLPMHSAAVPTNGDGLRCNYFGGQNGTVERKYQCFRTRQGRSSKSECGRTCRADGRPRTTRRPYYNRRPRRPQQPREAAVPIHIYPLGGLGEVGKNMTVYECNGDMIIVDCGLVFPDSDMYGVDMVIPDFTFVVQNKDKIKGLLITHGHEDHIGSIPYLLQKFDLAIYGTRLTCGLIRNKLEEFGLAGKTKFVEITPWAALPLSPSM